MLCDSVDVAADTHTVMTITHISYLDDLTGEKRRESLESFQGVIQLQRDFKFIEPIDERWDIKIIKEKFASLEEV